ncbi:MAG: PHP domain-containing protein [bacterium]|nr:PHP domain-containing protein [bacterium]
MKAVDLHVHSNKSDGSVSPSGLVELAVQKELRAFALTDHDTIDGLDEAIFAAVSYPDLEVIPGIELSSEYHGKDIHVVGLYLDYHNEDFLAQLHVFQHSRVTRNEKMCNNLREAGIDITFEKLQAEYAGSVITRAHYARYLLSHGYVQSLPEAFDRYVGDHTRYFVPREKITPVQAVELILRADGIPILAHPTLYHMSDAHLEELVVLLKEAGLVGMECVYSTFTPAEEREMKRLADRHGLLYSGGSDFHGKAKPNLEMGTGYGHLFVPETILDELVRYKKRL